MRQITIIFKQEDIELVACTADFGNRDDASELENKLADVSQASIRTALGGLPADLLGGGCGPTEHEAEQLAKLDAQPRLPRDGDPKNPGENSNSCLFTKMASRILPDYSIIQHPDCLFRCYAQSAFTI